MQVLVSNSALKEKCVVNYIPIDVHCFYHMNIKVIYCNSCYHHSKQQLGKQ